MKDSTNISVVIPAYNEEIAVATVVSGLRKLHSRCEIIVVNDGSLDTTAEVAVRAGATVLNHESRLGYGASLRTGIQAAHGDYVLVMDGDGQHDPQDASRLIEVCQDHDMVVGSRGGQAHGPWSRRPGKFILAKFANFLASRKIPDCNSGFRLFKKEVLLRYLHLMPEGFSFSLTSTLAMIKGHRRITYVPIQIRSRKGKSMVAPWRDGPRIMLTMIRLTVLFEPLRVFLPIAGFLFVMGVGSFFFDIILTGRIGVGDVTVIFFVSALLIAMFGLLCDQISAIRRERHEQG